MSLVVLLLAALAAGLSASLVAARRPLRRGPMKVEAAASETIPEPEVAAGLALAAALMVLIGGGLVLGVLAFVVRTDPDALGIDAGAAAWGARHRGGVARDAVGAVTRLGQPATIIVMAALLTIAETIRTRSRWAAPFLVVVVAGNGLLTTTAKDLIDRVRPTLDPVAQTLGPSFPSGHSSWAAAFYAAAALLLIRRRGRRARLALTGLAVGLAVAVAASRVLLTVHWLSDVIAGLALGWAWFAVCATVFGGRLLRS